jgi:hypothetical protein
MHRYKRGYGWGPGFVPFVFHCGRHWHGGFPRRKDYLEMLEAYKEELEEMQRDIAEELKEVEREIQELKG